MKIIGITGSLASGKTTASKILSNRKGPLFSADDTVKKLYKKKNLKRLISKKFKLKNTKNIKNKLKKLIFSDKSSLIKLEKIIHPFVRTEMRKFIQKYRNRKVIFLEIPLLIESNLMKNFDIIIFIKAKKQIRLRRFISKGGDKKFFEILNDKQYSDLKKSNNCDFVVVNEKNLKILKKNLSLIIAKYE